MISESNEKQKEKIMFIEGPPTMNGTPHAGHLRGRVIKDLWYRYNTLCGKNIIFNAGWDTQGLPIELQAQKELGITGGKNEIIKSLGIEKLVNECKNIVKKYNEKWITVDNLLGMSFNQKDAYWTYKDEFIQREWQFLKKANETKILEEDFTVIAYCPSCQTSLSHAEVNQGYQEVKDPSLYYKVKLENIDHDLPTFLIVWTTMPFTLVTDAMVGLHPEEDYCHIKVNDEIWIVGKTRLEEFLKEAKIIKQDQEPNSTIPIIKTSKGSEFEGKKYIHPLLNEIPKLDELAKKQNYHIAVSEDFVDASTGSGLVHLSPANGEEDIRIAHKRNVTIFNPIDDEVKFTKDAGKYSGIFVRDADTIIVDDLKQKNALVKIGKIKHKYPLCWRSHHPIVWLARKGWFYKLDKLDQKAIDAASSVDYFFDQPKNRFLGIIKERHPWCISRERFWGCPIPVWTCNDCKNKDWYYSKDDIISAAQKLPDGENFELHRPWIDNIITKCSACGGTNTQREPYVLDTWHNSGSAPYSSLNSDDTYSEYIPAPFFTEGIDQTRGWAYTLLIENVILNDAPISPYKSFLFQGHVLDKNGNKMSKSLGNVLDGKELLEKYPVDLIRLYFIWKSSPIEPLNFSKEELMTRPYHILSTLYNLHLYFKQNSEYDNFDYTTHGINWAIEKNILDSPDKWLLSKLQKLVRKVEQDYNRCKFHEAAKAIDEYIIDILSQTYIPITRGNLWDEEEEEYSNNDKQNNTTKEQRRLVIYAVLHKVLHTLDILIHPICPYTSEYLYLGTFDKKQHHTSILLDSWPAIQQSLENDNVEESFDLLQQIMSISAAARMKGKCKRRWPLDEAIICVGNKQKEKLDSLHDILLSKLNVVKYDIKEIETKEKGLDEFLYLKEQNLPIIPIIDLDRKKIGPKAKQHMSALLKNFADTKPQDIIDTLSKYKVFTFHINDTTNIDLDIQDFLIDFEAKEGYAMSKRESNIMVFVSITRNKEMTARGLVNDIARRLQALRKELGYNPTDVLGVASILDLDSSSLHMIKEKTDDIKFLVRVKQVNFEQTCKEYKNVDIDGQKIRISIE
jgi:isoleucyl-tRNA synthetase